MKRDPRYYQLSIDLAGRKCVVVGGGGVARRKVRALLESGAAVAVISPEPCPELSVLAEEGQLRIFRRAYRPGDLDGAFLAFAATDNPEVNRQVVEEAKNRGILINIADDTDSSDFLVPATARWGELTVAVATGGTSPALARKMRDWLAGSLGDEYAALTELVGEVRAEVKRRGFRVSDDDWQAALDLDLLVGLLKTGEKTKAGDILLEGLIARQW